MTAGPPDESGQTLTFSTTNNNNALFSAQPSVAADGTLTYTPAPNANGSATVTVRLSDNGGTANGGVDHSDRLHHYRDAGETTRPHNVTASVSPASINENASGTVFRVVSRIQTPATRIR
jgi:hypothetical protein